MKKVLSLIILMSVYVLMFDSCNKGCVSKNLGTINFTPTDLQIVPYNGTETLTFNDSLGNSIIFTGKGRISSNPNDDNKHSECPDGDCGGNDICFGNYYYTQTNSIQFQGQNSDFQINILLDMAEGSFHKDISKCFSITVKFKDGANIWLFSCPSLYSYSFDAMKISSLVKGYNSLSYTHTLVIGPKTFNSVYVLGQIGIAYNNLEYVYYTINEGIVGFRTVTGKRWYLGN